MHQCRLRCRARCCLAIGSNLKFTAFPKDTSTHGETGDLTANFAISEQPELPPGPCTKTVLVLKEFEK